MTVTTLAAILKQYLSLRFPVSSLCFQGGEPLLADPHLYYTIPELFDRYAHDGQILEVSFQTNGVGITREWTNLFALLHALVGVSLDGPENIHDAYRVASDEKGTFISVMNGIDLLRKDNIPFNILTMITDKSVGHADAIYTFFMEQGYNWLQFIPCVEIDSLTNELSEYSITSEGFERFYSTLFDRWFENGYPDVSIRLFEDILFALVDGVTGSCTHGPVCDGNPVIEYNGDVYPCDFFVDPAWCLGTIHEQPIDELLRHPLRLQFMQLKKEYASGCGNCKFNALCHGGCPKHYLYCNSGHTPGNHLCTGYHRFLDYTYERFLELRDDIVQRRNAR